MGLVGLFRQSCGHQQTWYEKTLGAAKVRISYFGNLMVTITTDTKINLEHSKFLWSIWQSSGHQQNWYEKNSWHNHNSYRLFWQSYGYHHKRYENRLGTFQVLMDYVGNRQVTNKNRYERARVCRPSIGDANIVWSTAEFREK